jgi:hypothetical protein
VRELCVGKKFDFASIGAVSVKGFPQPIEVDEVRWKD